MKPPFLILAAMILILGSSAGWIAPETAITAKASPVVYVNMGENKQVDDNGNATVSYAHGTGIDIGNGYVLTAAHVADDPDFGQSQLKVVDSLGHKHDVEMLWANHNYDVALLRITDPDRIAAAHLSCRYLDKGEKLTFAGNPFNLHDITTWGRVSNGRIEKIGPWAAGMVVSASIDPGMSGGPTFDAGGNVVGINVGTIKGSGLGMIVPGRVICGLMDR